MEKPTIICLEGNDYAGKTTLAEKLKKIIESEGKSAVIYREPGSTELGEELRTMIFEREKKHKATNLMLFLASRLETMKTINEKEKDTDYIILDRFDLSTYVYQSKALGIEPEDLLTFLQLLLPETKTFVHHYVHLYCSPETAIARASNREQQDSDDTFDLDKWEEIESKYQDIFHMIEETRDIRISSIDTSNMDNIESKLKNLI